MTASQSERSVTCVTIIVLLLGCQVFTVVALTCCQAVLFRSLSVLDEVRVGDIVAVSSPPLPADACAASPHSSIKTSGSGVHALGIRRVAAVAGDELVACDDGEVMVVPPGFVWLTCDNASGCISSRVDSRVIGPVSLYDVAGRALSLVTSGARPAALSTNALSVSEDLQWARLECVAFVFEISLFTFSTALCTQFVPALLKNHDLEGRQRRHTNPIAAL
jgi:hypothetical protein